MRVTVIIEGSGLDLSPIQDLMELIALEKERYLSEWIDNPQEVIPPLVVQGADDIEIDLSQSILNAVREMNQTNINQNPVVTYLYNKITGFQIPFQNIVGILIRPNRFELILEDPTWQSP